MTFYNLKTTKLDERVQTLRRTYDSFQSLQLFIIELGFYVLQIRNLQRRAQQINYLTIFEFF